MTDPEPHEAGEPAHRPGTDGLLAASFERSPFAELLIDSEGEILLANAGARRLLGVPPDHAARGLGALEAAGLPVDVVAVLERVRVDGTVRRHRTTGWMPPGATAPRTFEVLLTPLDLGADRDAVAVVLADVTDAALHEERVQRLHQELASTYAELQTANEELRSNDEELQSVNAELQSSSEELRTTHEELRARKAGEGETGS